ncbi:killer cell lectin-like receptor subfamily B member 1B allele B isoform X2 [Dasypus novemcinctus]|uniref:killer cell lectin-like receptor subfamily B member 1B allele B isoform X2 n=1 Tax=Dasypus novemcinctus TaxID=9361 RepID=UPI00265E1ABF|nr:killer cell lectin-like receptor subfamily B member 1B allele B isoform X2 [Dasypus novemcinctus]
MIQPADDVTSREWKWIKWLDTDLTHDSYHYGIFQKVGCAVIIILVLIVIVLSIYVFQLNSARHTEANNESIKKVCTGENKSGTNSSIDSSNRFTANQSCPSKDWKLHEGKCYWVSETKNSWKESQADCAMKNSLLFVIRDFIDMSFLWLHLNTSSFYWMGLSRTTEKLWIWTDNSSFDVNLFPIKEYTPQTRGMKCALLSRKEISVENCEKKNQWICRL